MQFGADADIYMDKKGWNSDTCNINQWDVYNSRADTDIKWYKYQSSLPISHNYNMPYSAKKKCLSIFVLFSNTNV